MHLTTYAVKMEPGAVIGHYITAGRRHMCPSLPCDWMFAPVVSNEKEPSHMMVFCLTMIQLPVYMDFEGIITIRIYACVIHCTPIFLGLTFLG